MNTTQLIVFSEIIPGRIRGLINRWTNERLGPRIGEEKHLAAIESEYFSQTSQNLVGRMAFARFEMTDVWGRDLNSPTDLLLGQVQLTAAFANQLPKVGFGRTWHRSGVSLNCRLLSGGNRFRPVRRSWF